MRFGIIAKGGAEVEQFDGAFVLDVDQDVLRLEVAVRNILAVAVRDSL